MSAPTQPGWWWRESVPGYRECVRVQWHSLYPSEVVWYPTGRAQGQAVADDGFWLCEVPTPERIAADAERLERYADALTRIRWCESDPERIADRAIMGVDE